MMLLCQKMKCENRWAQGIYILNTNKILPQVIFFSVFHVPIFTNYNFKELLLFHYNNAYEEIRLFVTTKMI